MKYKIAGIAIIGVLILCLLETVNSGTADPKQTQVSSANYPANAAEHALPPKGAVDERLSASEQLAGALPDIPDNRSNKIEPDDIYNIPAPKGILSIYPKNPASVYTEGFAGASQGDDRKQYQLAKALKECIGVPDEQRIKQLEQEHYIYIDDALRNKLQQDLAYCADLLNLVGIDSIEQEYNAWYEKALMSGNKMAMANHWFEHSENFTQEKALAILEDAMFYPDSDIYHYIASYYATYFTDYPLQEKAWDIIHCRRVQGCSSSALTAYYDDILNHYEKEDLTHLLKAIETHLAKKTPHLLTLDELNDY